MKHFGSFYLDREKDMIVEMSMSRGHLFYVLKTPNHHTGNLITNLARLCQLPLSYDENGLKIIKGEIPCYYDAYGRQLYIFRLAGTKVANIYPDGRVEMKASIPSLSKTLMSQTKDYKLDVARTIIKTYVPKTVKFTTDLHTHMNGNLAPDILIALGIFHQIRYPLYYIRKLNLSLTEKQEKMLEAQRERVARQFASSPLTGKYLDRKINDNTFINFAQLILDNIPDSQRNIRAIRDSLAVLKDGQAVFTNLEKVYLYRYVFTKGRESEEKIRLKNINKIGDGDIRQALEQMIADSRDERYKENTLFMNKLLWIGRQYSRQGIRYVEISDTTLVKRYESVQMLKQVHKIAPLIYQETGVMIRFLAAIRRVPLAIVKDNEADDDYLKENLAVLRAVSIDPYVAGSDFVGEEINDIRELKPVIEEIVRIAAQSPGYTIRIHAGENDSLRSNVAESINCVRQSLGPGQKMPMLRIGHGLYTANLRTAQGRQLIRQMHEDNVILEFQITSNVRLNNLNSLDSHPLRQYLKAGISCIQGTDGAGLYGTSSIDEQLALEKMLQLSSKDMLAMKKTEERIVRSARKAFAQKQKQLNQLLEKQDFEQLLYSRMTDERLTGRLILSQYTYDANTHLKNQIEELPWDKMPVVLIGGSFNTKGRQTRVSESNRLIIDDLINNLDPNEVFFVIGHKMSGYEKYLAQKARNFKVFAFVPSYISKTEMDRMVKENVRIRVSNQSYGMAIYKSFNYEIFERRPSVVIAFDGNSAGVNLIQEARNGKGKAMIYVNRRCSSFKEKALSLQGYVELFDEGSRLADKINSQLKKNR